LPRRPAHLQPAPLDDPPDVPLQRPPRPLAGPGRCAAHAACRGREPTGGRLALPARRAGPRSSGRRVLVLAGVRSVGDVQTVPLAWLRGWRAVSAVVVERGRDAPVARAV